MHKICLLLLLLPAVSPAYAQHFFLSAFEGNWKGDLEIIGSRRQVQRVPMQMEIKKLTDSVWLWKTTYAAEKPIIKNYTLQMRNEEEGKYMLDEGDGILIHINRLDNKLYALFNVEGSILACTYEIIADKLHYEIASGPAKPAGLSAINEKKITINSYEIRSLQRARLQK